MISATITCRNCELQLFVCGVSPATATCPHCRAEYRVTVNETRKPLKAGRMATGPEAFHGVTKKR
jgi:hypothetical protein